MVLVARERIGILVVNLGTPAAPTADALKPYLREFLSDRRVIEIPRLLWWPILHGLVLTTRPGKSAKKYASIWTSEGSPLMVYSLRQAKALSASLGDDRYHVRLAMRYGQPSIAQVMKEMMAQGVSRILVLPAYPQYAASSTGSAFDALFAAISHMRFPAELRLVRDYFAFPPYIQALAKRVKDYWGVHGQGERLVMSFHGVPCRTIRKGDPYALQCIQTGRLLAEALDLGEESWQITFQSRFGRAQWLKPYTQLTLEGLARSGLGRVDVVCPGFSADCLETLEEINMECRAAFFAAGGKEFHYIPALNDSPVWIEAMEKLVLAHTADWPVSPTLDHPGNGYSCPGCSCR
ncbi:MAG TPA: ferrochelatase [Burkholderiales bacterium]|nr:ferrochelatase [Burkholderiales bacterium]